MGDINNRLNKAYENKLLEQKGIDRSIIDSVSTVSNNAIHLNNTVVDKEGKEKEANAGLSWGIGFGSGLLIYITMFIFGAMVMRGVMEEKMNRIAGVQRFKMLQRRRTSWKGGHFRVVVTAIPIPSGLLGTLSS